MTLNGHGGTPRKITITGNTQQRMLTKAAGTDAPIVRVEAGAKVVFRNIFINGRPQYHVPDDKATETIYGPGLVILCEGPENGPSFVLWPDTEVTLDTGVTVTGRRDPPPLMFDRTDDYWPGSGGGVVIHGGKLTMEEGSKIINCISEIGGGVYIGSSYPADANSIFVMNGGKISDNYSDLKGAAVFLKGFGTNELALAYTENPMQFIMNGGTITNNVCGTSVLPGEKFDSSAVCIYDFYSIFTMTGGTIVDNTAGDDGAGVRLVYDNNHFNFHMPYAVYDFTYPAGAISNNHPIDLLYKNNPWNPPGNPPGSL
jgi:hypothetical protein